MAPDRSETDEVTPMPMNASHDTLLGTNEVLIAGEVVTVQEQAILLAWAERQYRAGRLLENPSDPGAYCTPFQSTRGGLTALTNLDAQRNTSPEQMLVWVPEVDEHRVDRLPSEFWSIRSRVVDRLRLAALEEDHYKGSFLGYIAPGTGVHRHRDARLRIDQQEFLILRCNILFRRPDEGGQPVVESTEFDVPDRGMWAFFPTELVHSATPVRGSHFRGLLSFGFLVRPDDVWQRRFRRTTAFEAEYGLDASDDAGQMLVEALRQAPEAPGVTADRIDLLEFIVSARGDFSILEAAHGVRSEPADIWDALHDLQRSGVVESQSSTCACHGDVSVL
jgi:hypothetical protein